MRLLIQRVKFARVEVQGEVTGSIPGGLLVFIGIARTDSQRDADYLADKLTSLRIFCDANGKMNLNIRETNGQVLIVSQFTLYADCRRGRRPAFDRAAPPEQAVALYNYFVDAVRTREVPVSTGVFQAMMEVHLVNNGPVTILLDSVEL
jgi:D-tyrosyl-tRNA(Tyr) deacylase